MKPDTPPTLQSKTTRRILLASVVMVALAAAWWSRKSELNRNEAGALSGQAASSAQNPQPVTLSGAGPSSTTSLSDTATKATTKRLLQFQMPPARWNQPTAEDARNIAAAQPTFRTSLRLLDLSRPPTEQELRMAGQLGDDLNPTRPADPAAILDSAERKKQEADNLAFGQAIQKWNQHHYEQAVEMFRQHRSAFSDSPWAAESEMHIGCAAQYQGRNDESALNFDWIVENTQPGSDSFQKGLLRRAILYRDQGKLEDAQKAFVRLLKTETRPNRVTYATSWIRQLSLLKGQQTALRDCAQKSMGFICDARGNKALGDELRSLPSPSDSGFKASEIMSLARSKNLRVSAVIADSARLSSLPVPFIAHYKDHHYVAVAGYDWSKLEVQVYDSRVGSVSTVPLASFVRQWSGLSILFDDPPANVRLAMVHDLDSAVGGCCGLPAYPSGLGNDDPIGCETSKSNNDPKGYGMPVWNINQISMNHFISDVPMWHQPAYGPPVSIELSYNSQDSLITVRPFGEKWMLNYSSYTMETPGTFPPLPGMTTTQGQVQVIAGDGHMDTFYPQGNGVWNPAAGVFKKLTKVADYTYDVEDQSGTVYRYGVPPAMGASSVSSLLLSITDRFGTALHITHTANGVIDKITHDAVPGGEWKFTYNAQGRVSKIDDPFGRSAQFTYNSADSPEAGSVAGIYLIGQKDMGGLEYGYAYGFANADIQVGAGVMLNRELFITSIITPNAASPGLAGSSNAAQVETQFRIEPSDGITGSSYPPAGQPMWDNYRITVTDPLGQQEEYFYDGYYRHSWHRTKKFFVPNLSATAAGSSIRSWFNQVLSQGEGVTGASYSPLTNSITQSNFDSNRLPQTVLNIRSQYEYFTYNSQGRVLTYKDPLNRITTYEYQPNGIDLKKVTNSSGIVEAQIEYFPSNRDVKKVTDALGRDTEFTYTSRGQVATVTKQVSTGGTPALRTDVFTLGYDGSGRLVSVALNGRTLAQKVYDTRGHLAAQTDETGHTLLFEYDDLDRHVKTTYPDGTFTASDYTCCTLVRTIARDGRQTKYLYDVLKRLRVVQQPGGSNISYDFDPNNNLIALRDGKGQQTRWDYDNADRPLTKTYADNSKEAFAYNNYGQLQSTKDRKQVTTTRNFDAYGRPQSLVTPGIPNVTFTYDALDHLASLTDGIGTTSYTYDNAHRRTSADGPWQNDTLTYNYDEYDRPVSRSVGGQVFESYQYDDLGRLASLVNALGTLTRSYDGDSARPLSSALTQGGATVLSTVFQYQGIYGDLRLKQIKNNTGSAGPLLSQFDYTYTTNGNLASWRQQLGSADPRTWSLSYDPLDQLTGVEAQDGAGTPKPEESHFYTNDFAGNRSSHQSGAAVSSDTHNKINQLITRSGSGPVHIAGTVDKPVKVQLNSQHTGASAVTVNDRPVLVDTTGKFATDIILPGGSGDVTIVAKDLSGNQITRKWHITSQAGAAFSAPCVYDANGNLITRSVPDTGGTVKVYRYEWDALDRLTAVAVGAETSPNVPVNGATRTEWTYDGQSRRVRQVDKTRVSGAWSTTGNVTFLWDGNQIVQQRDTTGGTVLVDYFGAGEQRRTSENQLLYYTRDHLGSVREVVDATGTVRARYDYDPYGVRTKLSGDMGCDWGFTGHYYHPASGLQLALYRAYDAELARWISADPIGEAGGINLYAYVGNKPTGASDPLGLWDVNAGGVNWKSPIKGDAGHPHKFDGVDQGQHMHGSNGSKFFPETGMILTKDGKWERASNKFKKQMRKAVKCKTGSGIGVLGALMLVSLFDAEASGANAEIAKRIVDKLKQLPEITNLTEHDAVAADIASEINNLFGNEIAALIIYDELTNGK